jgi:hypothetical protein
VRLRVAAVVLAAAALAGCANAGAGGKGRATVWVTRDEGAHVLVVRTVPAGLTAIQGLERVAHVQTRYGGRFVQAIDGIEGSLSRRQDWFYFVNGYEADRGGAEYVLRAGDVEWWDYRSWRHAMHVPVVVGAFPEPFLHGYGGRHRETAVVYDTPRLARTARRLARLVHARTVVPPTTRLMPTVDVLELRPGRPAVWVADQGAAHPGDAVRIVVSGIAAKLAANPRLLRFRYSLP